MSLDLAMKSRYHPTLANFNPRAYSKYWDRQKDPWGYLDQVGIEVPCEMLLCDAHPREIANAIGVTQRVLLAWVNNDSARQNAYEEAYQQAADNQMFDAKQLLADTPWVNEAISINGKRAEHARHMAKGLGSRRWGNKVDINQNMTATVSYQFNIALDDKQKAQVIEGESRRVGGVPNAIPQLDFNDLIGPGSSIDLGIGKDKGMSYEEAAAQEQSEERAFVEKGTTGSPSKGG